MESSFSNDKRAYARDYYRRNKVRISKRHRERAQRKWNELKEWMDNLQVTWGCVCCQIRDTDVLEFHHLRLRKGGERISNFATRSCTSLLRELPDVVVVCANCHKKAHAVYGRQAPCE